MMQSSQSVEKPTIKLHEPDAALLLRIIDLVPPTALSESDNARLPRITRELNSIIEGRRKSSR